MKKRGLSPTIATVLLVLLMLVLAAIIFLWYKGFLTEQIEKFGKPIETMCGDVIFEAQKTELNGHDALEIINKGNIDIFQMEIKMHKEGNAETTRFKYNVPSGSAVSGELFLKMKDRSIPEKITIYPAIVGTLKGKGSNRAFTCLNQGKTLTL